MNTLSPTPDELHPTYAHHDVVDRIAQVLRGRPPLTIDELGQIADAIGCNTSDLLPLHLETDPKDTALRRRKAKLVEVHDGLRAMLDEVEGSPELAAELSHLSAAQVAEIREAIAAFLYDWVAARRQR